MSENFQNILDLGSLNLKEYQKYVVFLVILLLKFKTK